MRLRSDTASLDPEWSTIIECVSYVIRCHRESENTVVPVGVSLSWCLGMRPIVRVNLRFSGCLAYLPRMNVFVTGGAGYIGSVCVEELINAGHQVTVFDNLTEGHRSAVDKRARFQQGDLSDQELISRSVREARADAVMHFAANALVGESMKYWRLGARKRSGSSVGCSCVAMRQDGSGRWKVTSIGRVIICADHANVAGMLRCARVSSIPA